MPRNFECDDVRQLLLFQPCVKCKKNWFSPVCGFDHDDLCKKCVQKNSG